MRDDPNNGCEGGYRCIGLFRILGIVLELACNRGSCGAIFSHANILNDIPPHELPIASLFQFNTENTNYLSLTKLFRGPQLTVCFVFRLSDKSSLQAFICTLTALSGQILTAFESPLK